MGLSVITSCQGSVSYHLKVYDIYKFTTTNHNNQEPHNNNQGICVCVLPSLQRSASQLYQPRVPGVQFRILQVSIKTDPTETPAHGNLNLTKSFYYLLLTLEQRNYTLPKRTIPCRMSHRGTHIFQPRLNTFNFLCLHTSRKWNGSKSQQPFGRECLHTESFQVQAQQVLKHCVLAVNPYKHGTCPNQMQNFQNESSFPRFSSFGS